MYLIRRGKGKLYHYLNQRGDNSLCRLQYTSKYKASDTIPDEGTLCKTCQSKIKPIKESPWLIKTKTYLKSHPITGPDFIETEDESTPF